MATEKITVIVEKPVTVTHVTRVGVSNRRLQRVLGVETLKQRVTVLDRRDVLVPVKERTRVEIDIPGIQGPPGVQGPPGEGAPAYILTAMGPISAHRVVAVVGGECHYPDLLDMDDVENIIGITANSAADGQPVTVLSLGEFNEVLWNWTPGAIYCGVADGILTQTPPTTGAVFEVARALTPTRVAVGLKTPTLRG